MNKKPQLVYNLQLAQGVSYDQSHFLKELSTKVEMTQVSESEFEVCLERPCKCKIVSD